MADGIIIEYLGRPEAAKGRMDGTPNRQFSGAWGILKAIEGSDSPTGAQQDIRVRTDFGMLTISFRFLKGSYNKRDWLTAKSLLDAFKE